MEKLVYTVHELQTILGVGRSKIYSIVEKAYKNGDSFRVVKIGKNYFIPIETFNEWLYGEQKE